MSTVRYLTDEADHLFNQLEEEEVEYFSGRPIEDTFESCTVQKFGLEEVRFSNVLERTFLNSPRLLLFGQKYNKTVIL